MAAASCQGATIIGTGSDVMDKEKICGLLVVFIAYLLGKWHSELSIWVPSIILLVLLLGLMIPWKAHQKHLPVISEEKALSPKNERFRFMFEHAGVGISLMDASGSLIYANPKLQQMFGYSESELLKMTFRDLSHPDDVPPNDGLLKALVSGEIDFYQLEKRYICKEGQSIWGKVTSSLLVEDEQTPPLIIGMVIDITDQKILEEQLKEANLALESISNTDSLTGLSNRRKIEHFFFEQWEEAISSQTPLSLILIDIDSFKRYNDYYGHVQGDECLKQVAGLLSNPLHEEQWLAGRYGGEEFLIVLPDCRPQKALLIAEELCQKVENKQLPHAASSVHSVVTISAGVAGGVPNPSVKPEHFLRNADEALYVSKNGGRNTASLYSDHKND